MLSGYPCGKLAAVLKTLGHCTLIREIAVPPCGCISRRFLFPLSWDSLVGWHRYLCYHSKIWNGNNEVGVYNYVQYSDKGTTMHWQLQSWSKLVETNEHHTLFTSHLTNEWVEIFSSPWSMLFHGAGNSSGFVLISFSQRDNIEMGDWTNRL